MEKHEISLTPGQAGELLASIVGVVLSLPSKRAQYWIGRKGKLAAKIKEVLAGEENDGWQLFFEYQELLTGWQAFYKKHFNQDKDFSTLRIPKRKEGFDRLIVVAEGMTPKKIFARIKSLMPAWKCWGNLDEIVSDRKADKDYAIWVRDRVEADEELKNKTANDLKKENIPGITLEERLLYELKLFDETGKHLDMQKVTVCAGSRDPDGFVPRVNCYGDEVKVNGETPDGRHDDLRARAAVS